MLFLVIINDQKEGEISEIIKLVADTKLVIILKMKSQNLFTGKYFFNGDLAILELFLQNIMGIEIIRPFKY